MGSAETHSVVAGDWKVTFDTVTPVSTNVMWVESNGLKNNGFYEIWLNASYQLAIINILENNPGSRAPIDRSNLEKYLHLYLSTAKDPIINDYKINGKDGLIGHGWSNDIGAMNYAAVYPIDLTPDKTASILITIGSFLGEKPSMEIINSVKVEQFDPRANSLPSNAPLPPIAYTRQAAGTRDDPIPIGTAVNLGDGMANCSTQCRS